MSQVKKHTKTHSTYAFESNTNSVAASQMRNALNKLADSVKDEATRAKFENELDSFFSLFRRYLIEKASGSTLHWEKIKSPNPEEVVDYATIARTTDNSYLFLHVLCEICLLYTSRCV